jgi:selenocysteine lyase/cysteine desulfurase
MIFQHRKSTAYVDPPVIDNNVIGKHHCLEGPFGKKPITYADSTASGKSLAFIEDYIRDNILPFYANTHTEASSTGLQTTKYREQARDFVRDALNAPKNEYAVIFTGAGVTGAIDRLRRVLGISPLAPKIKEASNRPVVFISHYEHHSNELPWRESQCDVVVIPEHPKTGSLDYRVLSTELEKYSDRPLKIGSFSAASNVTGLRSDTKKITKILHRHEALAFWDFAGAGPHVGIDMKGQDFDAVFLSVHKYVGGPSTPGVLAARSTLFTNLIPSVPGGGTIDWVDTEDHKYLNDIEQREEGGTPAIVASIRAGLVLRLHQDVGPDNIERIELRYVRKAFNVWKNNPNIIIVGNAEPKNRVSIVSFLVRSPPLMRQDDPRILHFNFVVSLLNDLFGIQTRGGCACAAPYLARLLASKDLKPIMHKDYKSIDFDSSVKPGWVRLGFSYYMSEETVDYIIKSVDLVASEGYRLLPWYKYNPETTMWTYCYINRSSSRSANDAPRAMELWDLRGEYTKPAKDRQKSLSFYYNQAHKLLMSTDPGMGPSAITTHLPEKARSLRWFALPEEIRRFPGVCVHPPNTNKQRQWDGLLKMRFSVGSLTQGPAHQGPAQSFEVEPAQ